MWLPLPMLMRLLHRIMLLRQMKVPDPSTEKANKCGRTLQTKEEKKEKKA
jgi:hypothetical protein